MIKGNCIASSCKTKIYQDDKCIFHCDKDMKNEWDDKVSVFWKSFIASGYTLPENSIIPYYSNEKKINNAIELNCSDTLVFENCTFVGDFFLRYEKNQLNNYKKISFINCTLKNITLINISTANLIFENVECDSLRIAHCDVSNLEIGKMVVQDKFTISKIRRENTELKISNANFNEVYIQNISIQKLSFTNSKIENKLKMTSSKIDEFNFQNNDFLAKSKILLQHITIKKFIFRRISQDAKYIQFNEVKVQESLNFSKVEFHNTYFNNCDFSQANKNLSKTTFNNATLNSIKWGNKNNIEASRDIFRDLKNSYDNIQNYIEANNFFSMEMKAYKKELFENKNKSMGVNYWQEKTIFFINEKISNFSQSWFLPLLWILLLNYSFFIFQSVIQSNVKIYHISSIVAIGISFWIIGMFIYERFRLYTMQHILVLVAFISIVQMFSYGNLSDVLKFSYLQSWKDYEDKNSNTIFLIWSTHKILLGFLIYHFVVALRRQTRR